MTSRADLFPERIRQGLGTFVIGREVHFYPAVASTQDVARAAGRTGAPEGEVFIADQQTAGRGRLGRRWQDAPGGSLLLSVLLRPSAAALPRLSMAAALAVLDALEEVAGLRAALKWPNDVLIRGRKAAGLLVEGEFLGDAPEFAVLGIGINVNLDPEVLTGLTYPATSLKTEAGGSVSRLALVRSLLRHLDHWYRAAGTDPAVEREWRQRLETLGRRVRADLGGRLVEGVAEDVDANGALVLRTDNGETMTLLAAEVTLQA